MDCTSAGRVIAQPEAADAKHRMPGSGSSTRQDRHALDKGGPLSHMAASPGVASASRRASSSSSCFGALAQAWSGRWHRLLDTIHPPPPPDIWALVSPRTRCEDATPVAMAALAPAVKFVSRSYTGSLRLLIKAASPPSPPPPLPPYNWQGDIQIAST
jgi:hypothetical protein